MLREHGAQRPSVFDLLDAVHKMHGTQSKFHYVRNMHDTVSVSTTILTIYGVTVEPRVERTPVIASCSVSGHVFYTSNTAET